MATMRGALLKSPCRIAVCKGSVHTHGPTQVRLDEVWKLSGFSLVRLRYIIYHGDHIWRARTIKQASEICERLGINVRDGWHAEMRSAEERLLAAIFGQD